MRNGRVGGRRAGWFACVVGTIGVAVAAGGAAHADPPQPFAIPIAHGKPALGAGWDSKLGFARGEAGACVEDVGTERVDAPAVHYSIATLTRAGGRLVLGVHVAAVAASETLSSPRLTDASRRLAQGDVAAFRDLCGDGFVARVDLGGHWLGELEVAGSDVVRASPRVTTGTWTDPEPFRAALEQITKSYSTTARELPDGNRAEARELEPAALVERAVGFPATVTAESAKPFLAEFAGYEKPAFSGLVLSTPEPVDGGDVAEQIFRSGRSTSTSGAASRAAEMRLAQVHHDDEPAADAEPIRLSNASLGKPEEPLLGSEPEAGSPPAAAAPAAEPQRQASAAATEREPVVRKQAALVYDTAGGPPVFATTRAPFGVHTEHLRERFYWVPGAAQATPDVVRAIEAAKTGAPTRGTTVAIVEVGPTVVVMTDAPPAAGVFSEPAGERRAWIAGVTKPDADQRAALDAAIRAEGAAQGGRQ